MGDGYFFNFDKMAYVKGPRPDDCILCGVRDEDEALVNLTIHRADLVMAAVNLYPYNPGHVLVFPTRHVEDLRDLTAPEQEAMDGLVRRLLDVLDSTHRPHGYNIGLNMGRVAGASITHLHTHIIPRFPGETGMADLIAGKRVLVEDPRVTCDRLREALNDIR